MARGMTSGATRRGVFGRLPRAAPNITATVIAIAREMAAKEDQNMMDAWKQGGDVNGKPVTDSMILAHWQQRMAGVSKDDPLFDTYQNAYKQFDYAIAESKQQTLYKQGKVSDSQMAAFYTGWAAKVPKDSEFFRVLQRDASQFMASSNARAAGNAKRAAETAYENQQDAMSKQGEGAGTFLLDTMAHIAQVGQPAAGLPGVVGMKTGFAGFAPDDPAAMLHLLEQIVPQPVDSGGGNQAKSDPLTNTTVVFHDQSGKAVTVADIYKQLHTLDPHFSGDLTLGYINSQLDKMTSSLSARYDLAVSSNHTADATAIGKSRDTVSAFKMEIKAYPVQSSYEDANKLYNDVISNPLIAPDAKVAAFHQYQARLMALSEDPRIAADDRLRSALVGEAMQTPGTVTLSESFTQSKSGVPSSQDVVARNKVFIDNLTNQVNLMRQNPGAYALTMGSYAKDGSGVFTADITGTSIGVADNGTIYGQGGSPTRVYIGQPGGAPSWVVINDAPITGFARNDNGKLMDGNSNPIGSVYTVRAGNTTTLIYRFTGSDGQVHFSTQPFWDTSVAGGIRAIPKPDGAINLDLTSYAKAGMTGIKQDEATLPSALDPAVPGKLTIDPAKVAMASDQTGVAAGTNPFADFYSLSVAFSNASADGKRVFAQMMTDRSFRAQMAADAYNAAGYSTTDGGQTWAPGPDANPASLAEYQSQNRLAEVATHLSSDEVWRATLGKWDRTTTVAPYVGADMTTMPGKTADDLGLKSSSGMLPLDILGGTGFAALGRATYDGTNILREPAPSDGRGMNISLGNSITVPNNPLSSGLPTYGPSTSVQPSPTPSTTTSIKPYQAPTYSQPGTLSGEPGYYGSGSGGVTRPGTGSTPS